MTDLNLLRVQFAVELMYFPMKNGVDSTPRYVPAHEVKCAYHGENGDTGTCVEDDEDLSSDAASWTPQFSTRANQADVSAPLYFVYHGRLVHGQQFALSR